MASPTSSQSWRTWLLSLSQLPNNHPFKISCRTYALAISLSLAPAFLPIFTSRKPLSAKTTRFLDALKREANPAGFAFAMTVAVGGGATLDRVWKWVHESDEDMPVHKDSLLEDLRRSLRDWSRKIDLTSSQRTFVSNLISSAAALLLLASRKRSSLSKGQNSSVPLSVPISSTGLKDSGRYPATLDLTLLLLVRALDSAVQEILIKRTREQLLRKGKQKEGSQYREMPKEIHRKIIETTNKIDAFVFWAASARIMWCFFYSMESLPRSYLRWIGALANVDPRLMEALNRRLDGSWTYGQRTSHSGLLTTLAEDLQLPPSWGDSLLVPTHGGDHATKKWAELGVTNRSGIGGVPCEIVHGDVGKPFGIVGPSCTTNAAIRCAMGFVEAVAIYAPVHFIPILLSNPKSLLSIPVLRKTIFAICRSSLFLSVFISSIWSAVCLTRTLAVARLLPMVSHNFYDGPYGAILAGCLTCGSSIWIEKGKRRGEFALYVLPRALRSFFSNAWLRSGSLSLKITERLTFIFSLAYLLHAFKHRQESLRGFSRWALHFVMEGPSKRSEGTH